MDSDLFMECEEEELEPWQQQDSMDDSAGNAETSTPTVSSTPATVVDIPAEPKTVVIPNLPPAVNTANTVPMITNTITQRVVPAAVPTEIPKAVQGQPVILAPGAGGLGTMALSQVLLPGTSIANVTNNQPIYFTTQGLPVQNIQPGQSPVSLVLNVQQGQTVRPITLVQAPGTQIFKPAVGPTQIITQPSQIRAGAPVTNRAQTPVTFSTMQIPATLTIRTTTSPAASSLATMSSTTITQPSAARTTTKIVTIKPGNGPLDMQNLMNLVKSVNLPGGAQTQTFVVMSNQKTNNGPVVSSALPVISQNVIQTIPIANTTPSTTTYLCPRCGAQFRMVEALRSHMCFCCPDLAQMAESNSTPTAVKPPATPPKSAPIAPSVKMDSPPTKGGDNHPRLVMLVDDFYYGTFEGNRVYVPMDNSKEPLSFRCLTCNKKLKNNIRLMNHMRYHVELDQQNGEMDTHTSCQHCFRRFPTPFRLQCHLESVHTSIESSTKCKICEWSFENEPVFLQHMKNSHKPGEMPYVCQVCEYRSSFYSDVFNHFRTWHEDTRHLLCQYCLKVFKHSTSYQQHYVRHQKSTVYHCNKCRLQFLFTKDKVEHKINHHRTFRKPRELEGLQPGTKVTIRAYVGTKKSSGQSSSKASADIQKNSISGSQSTTLSSDQESQQQQSGKKQVSKMFQFLSKFQEQRALLGRHKCVECTFEIPDFANHYPTYVHCSLCFYSTCCSRAYANHMINNHVPGRVPKTSKKCPPSVVKLSCAGCEYTTAHGNLMSKHLIKFPAHSYCLFVRKECLETDIEFCHVEEEVEGPQGDEASDVGTQPDWLSMKQWNVPKEEGTVPEFMDSCGPQHTVTRNNDVLDYFQLLFPDTLFEQIVSETNAYATYCCSSGRGDSSWHPVSVQEIKGFFGLSILMGLQNLVEPDSYWTWEQHQGRYGSRTWELVFRTMSVSRFKQISTYIRMSSMLLDNDNQSVDKLSFFQPMLNILQTSMREAYRPNKCLTIDQAFLPSHDKGAAQEKSKKSQPKIWLLCDSKSGYCHKLLVVTRQKHKDLGRSVVPQLTEGLEGKHHNLFLSSSLASVPLMKELYGSGIYCSSSVLPHSSVLPKEFWDEPSLDNPGSFRQYEFAPLLATRWKDNKELVCLSTNANPGQSDVVWRRSPTKMGELCTIERPQAFKLLQDNMRGVDICNQLLTCNQLGGLVLDSNWRRLFWFLVNLSIINSFIVLRETRKDNPPVWLPGGHFSQALYRKRLGYQLAKCAERYTLQSQVHDSMLKQETVKKENLEVQEEVRHRLGKITRRTRRCKVCNLKNIRHESMYGCTVCLVNLCKRSRCFWDFHGFPTNYQGNAKVGFVDSKSDGTEPGVKYKTELLERRKSSVDISNVSQGATADLDQDLNQGVDQEMAPLEDEDSDSDTDTIESDEERKDGEKKKGSQTKPTLPQPVRNREESLTIHQRRILLLALCAGIQKAAKEMDTKPQLIKTWIEDKEEQLNECCSNISGEAVDRLVEWVLTQRELQRPINEAKLFEKASELQSQTNETNSFRISYDWAVNFMMQHKLGLETSFVIQRELPSAMEENCGRFTELAHGQIKTNNIPQSVIGAMDQLSVFVNVNMLNEKNKLRRETALQFTGSGKPFVKIYLGMLANGTMLPAALFTSHTTSSPPDTVLLMSKEEGYKATEELEVWANKVWKQHLDSQNESEALLVVDSHHCQTSENILSTVSGTRTFPAIIPAGCTCRHQPLEMCVRPVLQRLFVARWAQQPTDAVQPEDLMQLLVSWLDEAISYFSLKPEVIQHSFCLARLLPDQEAHTNLPATPFELLNMVSEAMLGPEVVDLESADEEEPMDIDAVDKVSEKIDLTEEQEDTENEEDKIDDDKTKDTEHQKEKADDCLEIASESTDFSHSSPEPETPSHNSEPDHLSESVVDANTIQTDSANR